jgi:hypothetical protein
MANNDTPALAGEALAELERRERDDIAAELLVASESVLTQFTGGTLAGLRLKDAVRAAAAALARAEQPDALVAALGHAIGSMSEMVGTLADNLPNSTEDMRERAYDVLHEARQTLAAHRDRGQRKGGEAHVTKASGSAGGSCNVGAAVAPEPREAADLGALLATVMATRRDLRDAMCRECGHSTMDRWDAADGAFVDFAGGLVDALRSALGVGEPGGLGDGT